MTIAGGVSPLTTAIRFRTASSRIARRVSTAAVADVREGDHVRQPHDRVVRVRRLRLEYVEARPGDPAALEGRDSAGWSITGPRAVFTM